MKCPSCEAEWQTGKSASVLAACPFCGASLAPQKKEEPADTSTIQGVLRTLVQERGAAVYKRENAGQLKALLSDLAVDFPRERKVLGVVLTEGVQERLLKADGGTEAEKQGEAAWCRLHLTEELAMMEDRATEAVNILAAGLGWEPPLEPTPAASAQPQGVPQQPQGAPQPSPIVATRTETVVATDGTGDYTAVQDAIDATVAGGTIRIKPGVYKGSVTLQKPLRIAGMDGSIGDLDSKDLPVLLLGADGHLTVTEQAAGAKISGVVFAQFAEDYTCLADYSAMRDDFDKNSTSERARAVKVWNSLPKEKRTDSYLAHIAGDVEFIDAALLCPKQNLCEISAGSPLFTDCCFGRGYRLNDADGYAKRWTGFDVKNDASPVMNRCAFGGAQLYINGTACGTYCDCDIAASGGSGILIKNDAKPAIERCEIHDSRYSGVVVFDSAAPAVRDCKVYRNTECGFYIYKTAAGTYEHCVIHDNADSGMRISDSAAPSVHDCVIRKNHGCGGLFMTDHACGTYERCDIHNNSYGVSVTDSAAPAVRGCEIYGQSFEGIFIKDDAKPAIERCVIHDNSTQVLQAGTSVSGRAKPVVRGCEIYGQRNRMSGIWIQGSAGGTYEDCDIHGNWYGISIEDDAKPAIEHCVIHDNETGIEVTDSAVPSVHDCVIRKNSFCGLRMADHACGTYEDCDIRDNTGKGMVIADSAEPVITKCKIHDNKGGYFPGILAGTTAKPVVRGCEIYGHLSSGIWITGSAGGTYEDCDIHDNSSDGVDVTDSAAPAVRGCKVYRNTETGFYIHKTAAGTYERCVIHDNKTEGKHYPGIVVSDSAKPVVLGCEIYGQLSSGIWIKGSAGGTYEDCTFRNNTGRNVRNDSSASPRIRNCE